MKLIFKQRLFSWFDSYDIYNESGNTIYSVEGKPSFGHKLHILDASGRHIATIKQVLFSFLPRFDMYIGENLVGSIKKDFTFFKPSYSIDFNGWHVSGDLFEWDYEIKDRFGNTTASISKQLWNWTDTYSIDISDPAHALNALMVVLAIDAEKCSRD